MQQDLHFDITELEGKSFECLAGCAMCCFCQPELNEEEYNQYISDEKLKKGLTNKHISGRITENPNSIKLQGKSGACHFLTDKRCRIYARRPRMCIQFPIHIHLLDRIQLNANLSCRGIVNDGGLSLIEYWNSIEELLPAAFIENQLNITRKNHERYEEKSRSRGIFQEPERMKETARRIVPILKNREGLAKLLAFTSESPIIGDKGAEETAEAVSAMPPADDLDVVANEANYAQFELEDPAWLPVYTDKRLQQYTFRSRDGNIEWIKLNENGSLEIEKTIELNDMELLEIDGDGLGVFATYAETLIGRDHFRGYVYSTSTEMGFNDDLMTVYLGVLGTTLLDLWWRSSLLGAVYERSMIDTDLAKEGIISFDMDLLDAPTLGAFI